jgi:hypothetical protein
VAVPQAEKEIPAGIVIATTKQGAKGETTGKAHGRSRKEKRPALAQDGPFPSELVGTKV